MRPGIDEHLGGIAVLFCETQEPVPAMDEDEDRRIGAVSSINIELFNLSWSVCSSFMQRYAPNKMELASHVVSRAEQTEINEGRGFPDGTVALDITKVPRKRTLEALREIVNIGRDFAGVDITRQPIHIRPGATTSWAASRATSRRDVDPGALRRRRGRLRVGARRQPAGRELAAGHADLRPPLGRARRRPPADEHAEADALRAAATPHARSTES